MWQGIWFDMWQGIRFTIISSWKEEAPLPLSTTRLFWDVISKIDSPYEINIDGIDCKLHPPRYV
jgi:hypothetical protein